MNEIHMLNVGAILSNLREVDLVHRNHTQPRCYPLLQIMCVLDPSCVIQMFITNCKQI